MKTIKEYVINDESENVLDKFARIIDKAHFDVGVDIVTLELGDMFVLYSDNSYEIVRAKKGTPLKQTISTLEGVELTSERCSGNTTRQIDKAIQDIFKGYKVKVEGHYWQGKKKEDNRNLFHRIVFRLTKEHCFGQSIEELFILDKDKLTIELK